MRTRIMSQLKKVSILITLITCLLPTAGLASDILSRLTNNGQYALALGTITSVSDSTAEFHVEAIIAGYSIPGALLIEVPERYLNSTTPKIQPNDFVVLSLDREGEKYLIAYGIFHVSSLDLQTLEVLDGPLWRGDLAALEWYINSGGLENDFYFVESTAYVRNSDGTSIQIYPKENENPSPASDMNADQDAGIGNQSGETLNHTAASDLAIGQDSTTAAASTEWSNQELSTMQADLLPRTNPIFTSVGMVVLLGLCWVLFYKLKAG
jgi:hypothetical protein